MASHASAINKGAVAAVICVALVLSWVGEPAQGAPSHGIDGCIVKCPSKCNEKAASTCEGVKRADFAKCRSNCIAGCNASYHSAGSISCDECDSYCLTRPVPRHITCVSTVIPSCKGSCEKACNGANN